MVKGSGAGEPSSFLSLLLYLILCGGFAVGREGGGREVERWPWVAVASVSKSNAAVIRFGV